MKRRPLPLLSALLLGVAPASATEPIEIGDRLELFVDRHLVESMEGLELRLHHPVKATRPKSPLPVRHMVTVIKDGELYRAWYRGHDPDFKGEAHSGDGGEMVHYAESDDGHEWRFPALRLHEVGGSLENNVILARMPNRLHNFMPFLDTREGVDPQERYKAISGYPGPGNKIGLDEPGRGLFAYISPDGIRWTEKGEAIRYRPEWRHAFDSPNVAFWSEAEGRYVCYFRTWGENGGPRSISRATSPDFETWSDPVPMNPNRPGEHLYTNMTAPYPRAPHLYLAFPTRFVPGRGSAPGYEAKDLNVTDVLFMSSRAGSERYDRTFAEAFIRPGLDPAQWENRANYVANGIQFLKPREISIYHRSGDRYVLRTDGFVSVHAGLEEGELLSKPLVFSGAKLVLNYSSSAAGGLRVEIQNADGSPVEGFGLDDSIEIYGDRIAGAAAWKGGPDLAALAGRPVRLRFVLREADLYAFRFR
jgi:hypothetical protein